MTGLVAPVFRLVFVSYNVYQSERTSISKVAYLDHVRTRVCVPRWAELAEKAPFLTWKWKKKEKVSTHWVIFDQYGKIRVCSQAGLVV